MFRILSRACETRTKRVCISHSVFQRHTDLSFKSRFTLNKCNDISLIIISTLHFRSIGMKFCSCRLRHVARLKASDD